ncbi:MAG: NADP-dependent phosphogluconate dehydrogenase, partial [Tissierellia bacterium]|nr:NADP-dependent phosphogluconate dehydrogenase [Tissierellia bacterium]
MNDIGLIGLGVMGRNLALNIEDKGYSVSVYNRRAIRTQEFMETEGKNRNISGFYDLEAFVNSLSRPRKIILMIKPGKPVDDMIESLLAYLDKGDLIMDGGNTYFPETARRIEELKGKDILYLGIGVSGGELGALEGPSIMPGGRKEAYELVEDLLLKIAAKTEDGPCCSYMGRGAAGHFIKMLHNGIEYGMMQSIAEAYDIMRKALKLSANEISKVFEEWNDGELNSYLIEISYKILTLEDEKTKRPL